MLEIPLSPTHTCLIDETDLPLVKAFKWWPVSVGKNKSKHYAMTRLGGHPLAMHRLLLNAQKGQVVDHINRNGLDNRRKNLRFCTQSQNQQNRIGWLKRFANHTQESPIYKGVWRSSHGGRRWEARICWENKQRYIGTFDSCDEAAKAYDEYARMFHGKYARLNFPQSGEMGVHDLPGGIR